jgi:hypothetical protein
MEIFMEERGTVFTRSTNIIKEATENIQKSAVQSENKNFSLDRINCLISNLDAVLKTPETIKPTHNPFSKESLELLDSLEPDSAEKKEINNEIYNAILEIRTKAFGGFSLPGVSGKAGNMAASSFMEDYGLSKPFTDKEVSKKGSALSNKRLKAAIPDDQKRESSLKEWNDNCDEKNLTSTRIPALNNIGNPLFANRKVLPGWDKKNEKLNGLILNNLNVIEKNYNNKREFSISLGLTTVTKELGYRDIALKTNPTLAEGLANKYTEVAFLAARANIPHEYYSKRSNEIRRDYIGLDAQRVPWFPAIDTTEVSPKTPTKPVFLQDILNPTPNQKTQDLISK